MNGKFIFALNLWMIGVALCICTGAKAPIAR
jgi:hypothetical protein